MKQNFTILMMLWCLMPFSGFSLSDKDSRSKLSYGYEIERDEIRRQSALSVNIEGPDEVCTGEIIAYKGNGTSNNHTYIWDVNGGTIIFGSGTNEIQVMWNSDGNKTLSLTFSDVTGDSGTANKIVAVKEAPAIAPVSVNPVCEGSIIPEMATPPSVNDPGSVVVPGSGRWRLDDRDIIAGYLFAATDNGKLLSYAVETTACGTVSGNKIAVTVNNTPGITDISGLDSLCAGETLELVAHAEANGMPITGYQWFLDGVMIADHTTSQNTDTLRYVVQNGDNGKILMVKVSNSCGIDSTDRYILLNQKIITPEDPELPAVSAVPAGFMFSTVSAADKQELPDHYWENTHYWFVTRNTTYPDGTVLYLERGSDGKWFISGDQTGTTGYAFTVKYTAQNVIGQANTTHVYDEGTYTAGSETSMTYYSGKFFGLGTGSTPVVRWTQNSSFILNHPYVVMENFVLDGGNINRTEHFFYLHDRMNSDPNNPAAADRLRTDALIVKDVTFKNIIQRNAYSSFVHTPRGLISIDDQNGYYIQDTSSTGTPSSGFISRYASYWGGARPTFPVSYVYRLPEKITTRYLINLIIDNSCTVEGYNGATAGAPNAAAVLINSSKHIYIENLQIDANIVQAGASPIWIMQSDVQPRMPDASASTSGGLIFYNFLSSSMQNRIVALRYATKELALPDAYRFASFKTTDGSVTSFDLGGNAASLVSNMNNGAVTFYTTLINAASGYAYYDRQDGYWIIRAETGRTINQQLTDLSSVYNLNTVDKTPLPELNIKLIANSAGEITSFTVPDFGAGRRVNIVAVTDVDDPMDQTGLVPLAASNTVAFNSANAPYVKLYNFDFTENVSYYLDSVSFDIANAKEGNFYHCRFLGRDKGNLLEIPPANTYTLYCPSDTVITLCGDCSAVIELTPPVVELASGIISDADFINNAPAGSVFTRGVYRIMWTSSNICGSNADTCYQWVVVNYPPCGINDTVWTVQPGADPSYHLESVFATDYEGVQYPTVRINCDCWTAENSRSAFYADGTPVPYITVYNVNEYPDTTLNKNTYGVLYNWAAASRNGEMDADGLTQGVCPDGWTLPTVAQYERLIPYGSDALRESGTWLSDQEATNNTGFTALPAGYYNGANGHYYFLLGDTFFWTSFQGNSQTGKVAHIRYLCPVLQIEDMDKHNGVSVRCVKKC